MPPRQLIELDDFLTALRVNGVPVGPADIDRLRQLFALEPRLERHSLKSLLSALLVNTPAQRQVFEALFADWCSDREADWPEETADAHETSEQGRLASASRGQSTPPVLGEHPEPETPRRPLSAWIPILAAGVLLCAMLAWVLWPARVAVVPPATVQARPVPPIEGEIPSDDLPATPVDTVWFWQAEVDPQTIQAPWRLSPLALLLLGCAALATAGVAWWRYGQRLPDPPPVPRQYVGYGWQPLPPPTRDDGALIAARDRRQLVWNIDHFLSEDPTLRVDLPRTVEATARSGGFVHLHFKPAVYDREIWFWLDRQLDRPTPRAAIQQLTATLTAAGLETQQGWFTDLPDRVDWPAQRGYRPVHEEGHGRQALVAIFSDGEGLAQRLNNPLYRPAAARLLRDLRHWPRLCFVDCSASGTRLAPLLAGFDLECIALEALPHWLGGVETRTRIAAPLGEELYGDARVWAAAVALGGTSADTASAHSLRVALRLNVSLWQVDQILARAWQADSRNRLINWLLRCEPLGVYDIPVPGSLAWCALHWWWQRYAEAAKRLHEQENPLLPWQHSLASRRWELEQALLQLYTDPAAATRWLAQLADDELRHEVRGRLAVFAAADHRLPGSSDSAFIYLTWRAADLPIATWHTLRQLGFAAGLFADQAPTPLRHSPRVVLACTTLLMLALTALGAATYRWAVPEPPRLLASTPVGNHPALAAQTLRVMERVGGDHYQVTLGSVRQIIRLPQVPAGADIPVAWHWREAPNPVRLDNSNTVLLRAGRLAQPIRLCHKDWPQRSLAVIAAPYEASNPAARQLAIRLLDTGSADMVLLGTDWQKPLEQQLEVNPALNRATQVLVILPEAAGAEHAVAQLTSHLGPWAVVSSQDFAALARAIEFPGSKPVEQRQAPMRLHNREGDVQVYGGPKKPVSDSQTGIAWVYICPGTFTMGTMLRNGKPEDSMANDDEIVNPSRTVIMSAFDIAATETTEQQYVTLYPEQEKNYGKASRLPMVNLNWQDARAVCQKVGGDLPTEAQWEYATRGGSRFPWWFGDEEALLKRYAWYGEGLDGKAHEVAQKLPNPLGLYDMHGNVWEWVRDWYNKYASGMFIDPLMSSSGDFRVVRGGSFDVSPVNLRSARRDGVFPVGGVRRFGFRCVRVPPQHAVVNHAMQRLPGPCAPHPSPPVPVACNRPGGLLYHRCTDAHENPQIRHLPASGKPGGPVAGLA